jgi:hypothetical protein
VAASPGNRVDAGAQSSARPDAAAQAVSKDYSEISFTIESFYAITM